MERNQWNGSFENLQKFVENTWDGDVTFEDVEANADLLGNMIEAEAFLAAYPRFTEGIPFDGEDAEWDELLSGNGGAEALQTIVDLFE